ncbi:MAG TPA: S8 family serine peptidase, partial [candidate division Zixibacteria bacterium]|nr:S8 family serine peptidase [candidate division Zixibacteria bacterium]
MHRIGLILTILAFSFESLLAGDLDPQLANQISGKTGDQTVKVWIQLPRTENIKAFKTSLSAQSTSLAVQHSVAMKHFRTEHAAAQKSLLSYLKSLPKGKSATRIKSHWLVNMVEAEVPISDLSDIAARPDVKMVYAVPRITAITPVETSPAPAQTTSVQPNLTYIHAQDAWVAGYTGKGRLVCSFDTGVDGSSPYIHDNWKGLDGDSAAAWFDPSKNLPYPHSISNCGYIDCNTNHGTHVMGIMVGHSSTDTIGVAPDAKWISAAVIDLAGTSIVDAFEWAADPDGDPNTIGDMPDVINNSWGILDAGCENLFFNLIDNIEALGIVAIFAAGNEGTLGTSTIRNPAVRALDSLDCFAVGNVNNSGVLNGSSSRGPSTCPGGAIKPNVVAPGTTII